MRIDIGLLSLILIFLSFSALAQEPAAEEEEDFSMYADAELAGDAKRYCTSKVFDLSPSKLISIGYDFQGPYDMTFGITPNDAGVSTRNRLNHGLRLAVNAPVISKSSLLVNLGATYAETFYSIGENNHFLASALDNDGLRTAGLNFTVFKPLNEKNFFLVNASFELNGNFGWSDIQPLSYTKVSAVAVYGWKKHDRLMYGFGVARTYRIGELNYIPAFLYNYTFPSRKWGVEALFPARAHVRRTFNPRMLAFFGYELEGNSYLIRAREEGDLMPLGNVELRRSELRIRLMAERSLKDFLWVSVQAGFRYNWNFNVDQREFFRGFGDDPYTFENTIGNAFYANVSINLVSP